jgi:hypothetical protein
MARRKPYKAERWAERQPPIFQDWRVAGGTSRWKVVDADMPKIRHQSFETDNLRAESHAIKFDVRPEAQHHFSFHVLNQPTELLS